MGLTDDMLGLLSERFSPQQMAAFQKKAHARGDRDTVQFWQDRIDNLKKPGSAPPVKPPPAPAKAASPQPVDKPVEKPAEPSGHGGDDGPMTVKKALHGVWHAVSEPFKKAWQLATDKKYRTEVKDFVVKAVKKEGSQTKAMAKNLARALKGEKLTKEEKDAAVDQMADLVKTALLASIAGHAAAGGVAKLLATVASPADELIGVALDKPLRSITKKVMGREHGILPTSFYEESVTYRMLSLLEAAAYKEGDEYKLIENIVEEVLTELGQTDLSDDDIAKALAAIGVHKKPGMLDKLKSLFGK